jgi:hypothetical protein
MQAAEKFERFWDFEPIDDLIMIFRECIELNTRYKETFNQNRSDSDKGRSRNFDFDDDGSIFQQ